MKLISASIVGMFGFGCGTFLVLKEQGAFAVFIVILAFILAILILVSDKQGKAQADTPVISNEANQAE